MNTPTHRPILDSRNYVNQRYLTLATYRTTLTTSLLVIDDSAEDGTDGEQLTIELDRTGRDSLIAELMAANAYEDEMKAESLDSRENASFRPL